MEDAEYGGSCDWPGCNNQEKVHGYCRSHYHLIRYSSKREHLLPLSARAERCWVKSCDNPAYARGLCKNHYGRVVRDTHPSFNKPPRRQPASINSQRMRILRVLKGATLESVGSAAGISRERVRQLESRGGKPHQDTLRRISDCLGVSPEVLTDSTPITAVDVVKAMELASRREGGQG